MLLPTCRRLVCEANYIIFKTEIESPVQLVKLSNSYKHHFFPWKKIIRHHFEKSTLKRFKQKHAVSDIPCLTHGYSSRHVELGYGVIIQRGISIL